MNSIGSVVSVVSVGSNSGATRPTTVLVGSKRTNSRGEVLQKNAISFRPPSVDMRGDFSDLASLKADENDYKRNVIRHLAIVLAAIEADSTASAADKEVSTRFKSYIASLDDKLYISLGEVVAKVVESDDLAGVFFDTRRKSTQKINGLMATLRSLNTTLRNSTQIEFSKLRQQHQDAFLNAPLKRTRVCERPQGALVKRLELG